MESGVAPEAGAATPGPTLLFDMNALFEALLAARFREVVSDGIIATQEGFTFDVGRNFPVRPDIVIKRLNSGPLVVDAKWKCLDGIGGVDHADLRQAFAYARVAGAKCAALVYPGLIDGSRIEHEAEVNDNSGVRLLIRQVPLPVDNFLAFDQELCNLVNRCDAIEGGPGLGGRVALDEMPQSHVGVQSSARIGK
jgi:5-methylcytosine-specific restriction endonuclease McrBC regulatory subunit McrC